MSNYIITPIPIKYVTMPIAIEPIVPTIIAPCLITPIKQKMIVCPDAPIKIRQVKRKEEIVLIPRRLF